MSSTSQGLQSLSGVLNKVQKGAFSRRQKKISWFFVFDETQCQLRYYKTENDVTGVEPAGSIDIGHSSLSFDPRQQGLFVINSQGRDHWLVADSHDNMMHWLKALQDRRERWRRKQSVVELASIAEGHSMASSNQGEFGDTNVGHGVLSEMGGHKSRDFAVQSSPSSRRQTHLRPAIKTQTFSDKSTDSGIGGSLVARDSTKSTKTQASIDSQTEDSTSSDMGGKYLVVDEDYFGSSSVFPLSPAMGMSSRDKTTEEHAVSQSSTEDLSHTASSDCGLLSLNMVGLEAGDKTDDVFSEGKVQLPAEAIAIINTLKEELREMRTELARLRRHRQAYSQMLSSRDKSLVELEDRLDHAYQRNIERIQQSPSNEQIKRLEEECQAYQQQNAFLSNELVQLLEHRKQDYLKYDAMNTKQKQIEERTYELKVNYVGIIEKGIKGKQSHDESDDLLEDKGCQHLLQLLREAHKEAPKRIPVFERCEGFHVDEYGHAHDWQNEAAMQHYLCRLLSLHYRDMLHENDAHLNKWRHYVWENKEKLQRGQFDKVLKPLVRGGIPSTYRELMWKSMLTAKLGKLMEEKGADYYSRLCHCQTKCIKQIKLDLLRTLPNNRLFGKKSRGIEKLERVLVAYSIHNPTVGYCQGMNMLAAVCLFYLNEEDAFWCLVSIIEHILPAHYYSTNLIAAIADQEVLKEMMAEKLPDLTAHLNESGVDSSMITFNWFVTLFVDPLPMEPMLRIWDCLLLSGPKILFRAAFAIFKMNKSNLLRLGDPISLLGRLKLMSRLMYNGDALLQTAFDLGKFYGRSFIDRRREFHLAVQRKATRQQMTRVTSLRDTLTRSKSIRDTVRRVQSRANTLVWECAAVTSSDVVWLCQGSHDTGRLAVLPLALDPESAFLEHQFGSRITCIAELNSDVVLVGTLSWSLVAFSSQTGQELWSMLLTDSLLSLTCSGSGQTYVGLADGTIAYFEKLSDSEMGEPQKITVQDGLPVMCLLLVNEQDLWCGCGNSIFVLNALNFEEHATWKTDQTARRGVAKLALGKHGVWSATRGSSAIKLWHLKSFELILEHDCSSVSYQGIKSPQREGGSALSNPERITALTIAHDTVWVGTGGGWVVTFSIQDKVGGYCSLHPLMPHRISDEAVRCIVSSRNTTVRYVLTCPNQGLCMLWHPEHDEKGKEEVVWQSVQVMSGDKVLDLKQFLQPEEEQNGHTGESGELAAQALASGGEDVNGEQ